MFEERRRAIAASFTLALATACTVQTANDPLTSDDERTSLGSHQQGLFYESDAVWSAERISVCWSSPDSDDATERSWVQGMVETEIERLVQVDFTGWGTCGATGADIVISVDEANWPKVQVTNGEIEGSRAASTSANLFFNFFNTSATDLDADGSTDFAGCYGNAAAIGSTGRTWTSQRRRCIETLAIHEFSHMLGLAHEQNRSDTPNSCTEPDDGTGDTAVGYWDLTSVSNYCNPAWNNDGRLSPLDLFGLRALYGTPSAATNDLWLGLGNVRDYGGAAEDRVNFDINTVAARGGRSQPVVGDFDGDQREDIFWYDSSDVAERIWFGRADGTFDDLATTNVTADATTYFPIAGDFNDDRFADIFWYAPGDAPDVVWWGQADRTFLRWFTTNVRGTYQPVVGDFDGDGKSDLLWKSSTSTTMPAWFGRADGGWDTKNFAVAVAAKLLVGDFDGDGRSDLFQYFPGDGVDMMSFGNTNRTFLLVATPNVSGTYAPVIGRFDRNGGDDILWLKRGSASTPVWLFRGARGVPTTTTVATDSFAVPVSGDFNDDGLDDILWYYPEPIII